MFKKFKEWRKEVCWISAQCSEVTLTNGNVLALCIESIVGMLTIMLFVTYIALIGFQWCCNAYEKVKGWFKIRNEKKEEKKD